MFRIASLILLLLLLLPCFSALAQTRATGSAFDLQAANGISFNVEQGQYQAKGDVQLVVQDWVVLADEMVARLNVQRDAIVSLHATGQVFVQQGEFKARGSVLNLNLSQEIVDLTGAPTTLQFRDDRLVTDGPVAFSLTDERLDVAQDFALTLDGIVLSGRRLQATLGNQQLDTLAVAGNVNVERGALRAGGETLSYARADNVLRLSGAVVVQNAGVLLSGSSATYDVATGALSLKNNGEEQRVSGALNFQ